MCFSIGDNRDLWCTDFHWIHCIGCDEQDDDDDNDDDDGDDSDDYIYYTAQKYHHTVLTCWK